MKQKTFQVPSKKQPVWKVVSKLLKGIYKKPQILNLNEEISEKSILVANHSAMNGPVVYSLYFPLFHATLGAYRMLGNYKSRFRYLRDVYFVQKRGMKKFPATLIASFEAIFSIFFYRGMKVLPSYDDARVVTTIKNSIACIDANVPVMIFPEDSSTGYHEKLKSFSWLCGHCRTLPQTAQRRRRQHLPHLLPQRKKQNGYRQACKTFRLRRNGQIPDCRRFLQKSQRFV